MSDTLTPEQRLRAFFRSRDDHHRMCITNAPKSTPDHLRECDCYAKPDAVAHELIDEIEEENATLRAELAAALAEVARLKAEVEKYAAALKRHCQCRFDSDGQYEECHLHQCQRSVCENGDPTDVTLEAEVARLRNLLNEKGQ